MDLYEIDLSLFSGDLLAPSLTDNDADLPGLAQDGYQLDLLKPQAPVTGLLSESELSSPESSFQPAIPVCGELFGNQWLDVNTDLLELLGESKADEEPVEDSQMVAPSLITGYTDELAPLEAAQPEQGATALQILQSLAEENDRVLSSTPPPAEPSKVKSAGSSVLMGMLLEGMQDTNFNIGLDCMDVDVDEQLVLEASLAPILSPVSPEEVESLLSSGPCSPSSASWTESVPPAASLSFEVTDDGSEYVPDEDSLSSDDVWLPTPVAKSVKSKRTSARSAPYTKTKLSKEARSEERKLRKKQQNRDAALRYRSKKKNESVHIDSEFDVLEKRNGELKNQVDQMTQEIQYLKELMADVHRARNLLKPKK